VVVPDVRGMTKTNAQNALKAQHLNYQIDTKGAYVTDMNPKPGSTSLRASKIMLYTGAAPNYNKVVIVPNLKGLSKERAEEVLKSIGLKDVFAGSGMVSGRALELELRRQRELL